MISQPYGFAAKPLRHAGAQNTFAADGAQDRPRPGMVMAVLVGILLTRISLLNRLNIACKVIRIEGRPIFQRDGIARLR